MKNFILLVLVFLAYSAGCASPQIIIESSSPVEPKWISQPPTEPTFLYFVGSASRADSLEVGMNAARQSALNKIAGYLGTDVKSQFEMTSTTTDQDVQEKLKSNAEAFVARGAMVDSYHKKITRREGNSKLEHFDVFVLLKYPKKEATKESTRRETKDESTVHAAYNLFRKGNRHEREGRYNQARRFYQDAGELMEQVRDIVPLGQVEASDSQELAALLKRREEHTIRQLRKVVVWIKEEIKDQISTPSTMGTHISTILTKHMFTVLDIKAPDDLNVKNFQQNKPSTKDVLSSLKSQGAQFLVVGHGHTSFRSITMSNYFYEARGTLRVIDTHTGDTIHTIPIQHKGYDRNEEKASLNALKEAGSAAGELLVTELLKREDA